MRTGGESQTYRQSLSAAIENEREIKGELRRSGSPVNEGLTRSRQLPVDGKALVRFARPLKSGTQLTSSTRNVRHVERNRYVWQLQIIEWL
jgi:hypothetical protein